MYPVFFFYSKKQPTKNQPTHPNATSTSETLNGRTLGQTVGLKKTVHSPSLSPTEVRLGTIDFGSASLSGTDVGSTARVLVVHLVKVFRVWLYQWRAKRYSQFLQMFEPKEWRKKQNMN